jgi:hypothetical protein
MEPFAAFLLGFQFSSFRPLSDVFTFVGTDRPLFRLKARLVALQRVDGQLQVYTVDLSNPLKGTVYRHGHSPSTSADFADWVLNPNRITFCFPPHLVGPDIFFALLLENGHLLWVTGQSKYYQSGTGPEFCKEALAKTIPDNFLTERKEVSGGQVRGVHVFACFPFLTKWNRAMGRRGRKRILWWFLNRPSTHAFCRIWTRWTIAPIWLGNTVFSVC